LQASDRAAWGVLAQGYKRFYRTELPESQYEATWQRLCRGDGVHAWGARLDGRLVGIVHYLFHSSAWSIDVCYLQDLFVDEAVRGRGVARLLIERVARAARERSAPRLYWLTHEDNARARALYDRVAQHHGFIRYDHPLA
jgi:GNAT superfamily N-acetyltransferase